MAAPDPRARILVVDDDEGLLILMAEALRAEGHDVATAGSGQAAVQWLTTQTPDLMLLDLKLRDIDGPALLEKLQRTDTRIPFLVVTGQGDEKAAVEVMKRGALDYVMKDTALLDLLPTIVQRTLATLARERELAAAQAETRRLEHEVLAASERERRTIGADLHDGLGQLLTAVEFMCAALKADTPSTQPDTVARLDQMGALLREAVVQTRFLARGLVPLESGPAALQTGLAELASRMNSLRKVRCDFDCPAPVLLPDTAATGHLYRIAQEAVNNALKHAGATRVVIRLQVYGNCLELQVADDGAGLAGRNPASGGVGLGVMRHRAKVIGAELLIDSKPRGGVTIVCRLPLPA
ncbi:MAG TPA: response regulator [Lacunisphaera sp.]